MTPVDDYLKHAGFLGDLGAVAKPTALGYGVQTAVGLGMAGAAYGVRQAYMALTKKRDFDRMMEHNPHLHEARERLGDKSFNQYFTSLRNMTPAFSRDPIVAGTMMEQMVSGSAPGGVLQQSLQHADKSPGITRSLLTQSLAAPKFGPIDLTDFRQKKEDRQHAVLKQQREAQGWAKDDRAEHERAQRQAEMEAERAQRQATHSMRSDLADAIRTKGVSAHPIGRGFHTLPLGRDGGFRVGGETPEDLQVMVGRFKPPHMESYERK